MPRCCEASRSVGPKGPLASRAPSVFPGRADPPKRASAAVEGRKSEGLPGADTRIRAISRVCDDASPHCIVTPTRIACKFMRHDGPEWTATLKINQGERQGAGRYAGL